ncbi:MAG: GAF domain-containing protein [Desulfobacterales bacterium]|nr:GAF domain-containing protein [Desulfobacterales bacterium]
MSIHPDGYDLLKATIELSTSSLPIETKLERMLQSITDGFQSDRSLHLRPEALLKEGFLYRVAERRKPLWVDEETPFQEERVLAEERDLLCSSFACIPLSDETSFQGIFYIGFSKGRKFSSGEVDLLLLLAKEIGAAIRNDQLHGVAEETISQLTALHEMGKVVASTLKLEELLELSLTTGRKILKAKGGVLRIEEAGTGELRVKCRTGDDHQTPLDERMAHRVYFSRTPLSLSRKGRAKPFLSLLCVPLISKNRSFGTLAFYDKESDPSRFDEKDLQLLLTLANQMSCAIENAMTHHEISVMAQDHEKSMRQLSMLMELNRALLTTVNFERIVHMTLTAITIGDGLGFNRAMLFLVNDKDRVLQGTMAVGPNSAEEAGEIWSALSQRKGNPSELIAQIESSTENHSALNSMVKGIQIPLEHEQCILSRTVLEGRPFNIGVPRDEEEWLQTRCERGCHIGSEVGCYVSEHLSRDPKIYAFATIPLWGKGKVIGVILVDNFYNRNPITEEDIRYLSMFSNQAGLAIENAMLYRNLEEVHQELKEAQTFLVHQEKMAALGELSTSIAHEIRNPLVSIGGFARRLDRTFPADASEKRYAQTIVKEVGKLEKILTHILTYTHEEAMALKELDLREVVEESLSMISEGLRSGGIRLDRAFSEKVPKVKGDYDQLKQAFFNLINNAYESMNGKGRLSIRIHPLFKNGSSFVRVEVEDTGAGIDPESLHHIFNPFYTTKDNRLGLGLPIIHKIVNSHQGQIEVNNHPGKGVTFLLTLPAQGEKQR